MLPIPKKLVKQGVRDMVRISDARMSGTSYGACILHVSPESYIGGPLALVRTGDTITVDVPRAPSTSTCPRPSWRAAAPRGSRRRPATSAATAGCSRSHIGQANQGCDFDFLETDFGAPVASREIILTAVALFSQSENLIRSSGHPNDDSPVISDATRDKLKTVSTATIATALFKRGLRNQFIQDVHPLNPAAARMVGEAFTLRYMPAREDLNQLAVFRDRAHPQRKAVEDCPPGAVLVMDSRKDARAASAGSILVSRLMVRGVAGVVTDGGFRDSPEIASLAIPAYHHRPARRPT